MVAALRPFPTTGLQTCVVSSDTSVRIVDPAKKNRTIHVDRRSSDTSESSIRPTNLRFITRPGHRIQTSSTSTSWNLVESANRRIRFRIASARSSSSASEVPVRANHAIFQPGSPAHSAQYLTLPARKQVTLHDLLLHLNVKTCKACQHSFAFATFSKNEVQKTFSKKVFQSPTTSGSQLYNSIRNPNRKHQVQRTILRIHTLISFEKQFKIPGNCCMHKLT